MAPAILTIEKSISEAETIAAIPKIAKETCTDNPQQIPAMQARTLHFSLDVQFFMMRIMSGPGLIIETKVIDAIIERVVIIREYFSQNGLRVKRGGVFLVQRVQTLLEIFIRNSRDLNNFVH